MSTALPLARHHAENLHCRRPFARPPVNADLGIAPCVAASEAFGARNALALARAELFGDYAFGCLLAPASDRQQLGQPACKLLGTEAAPLKIGKLRLSMRPSIGILIGLVPGVGADALIKTAAAAMVRARRERLGSAFFDGADDIALPPSTPAVGSDVSID